MVRDIITRSMQIAAILGVLLLTTTAATAATALLQGKTIDKATGKPLAVEIKFLKPNGRTITTRSNATDGSYQQVLNTGTNYAISFDGYIPDNNELSVDIPESNTYQEITKDFQLTELHNGFVLSEFQAFKPNETDLLPEAKIKLKEIGDYLKANNNIQIYIEVTSYDSYLKNERRAIEKTNSRGKKYTKRVTIKTNELMQELLDARSSELTAACKANSIRLRDGDLKQDLKVVPESKKRQRRVNPKTKRKEWYIPDMPNVKIVIKKILKF